MDLLRRNNRRQPSITTVKTRFNIRIVHRISKLIDLQIRAEDVRTAGHVMYSSRACKPPKSSVYELVIK